MGDDEEVKVNIEKTDDEEEINARNEFSISLNDSTADHNRNANVTAKSKEKDVPELAEISLKILKEIRDIRQNSGNKPDKGGHFG